MSTFLKHAARESNECVHDSAQADMLRGLLDQVGVPWRHEGHTGFQTTKVPPGGEIRLHALPGASGH
eukprot:scaffold8528_cov17-Tisochrysis_lutea.AAC.3